MKHLFEPGMIVFCPSQPDWGQGQVQSVTGERVTVNFEDAGKRSLDLRHVKLTIISAE